MYTVDLTTDEARATLARVYLLTCAAGDIPDKHTFSDEARRTSLLAHLAFLLSMQVRALLPDDLDLGDDASVLSTDRLALLREAELLTRTYSIEAFPAGTSHVVVVLLDLIRDFSQ